MPNALATYNIKDELEAMKEVTGMQDTYEASLTRIAAVKARLGEITVDFLEKERHGAVETERLFKALELYNNTLESVNRKHIEHAGHMKAQNDHLREFNTLIRPNETVFDKLKTVLPQIAPQLVIMSVLMKEIGRSMQEMRSISVTGGQGVEALDVGGLQDLMGANRIRNMASGLTGGIVQQYATREQLTQGAGTMFGLGGLRGNELTEALTNLPEKAYHAGMKFSDVAEIMSKAHRVLQQSPEEMKAGFDLVTSTAKDAGFQIDNYAKAVYAATVELGAYGAELGKVNEVYKEAYTLVQENKITEAELRTFIRTEIRARRDLDSILKELKEGAAMASMELYKFADRTKVQEQVSSALVPYMKDMGAALDGGADVADYFTNAIVEGKLQLETLTGVVGDLKSKYNVSIPGLVSFTTEVNSLAKHLGMAGPEVARILVGSANSIRDYFDNPTQALGVAQNALRGFGHLIDSGKASMEDYNSVLKTQVNIFGDYSQGQFKTLASVVERTNMRMSELVQYTGELSKVNKQYSYDQTASNALLVVFNEQLRTGGVGLQDLQTVLKGPAGAAEGFRAQLVERMGSKGSLAGLFGGGASLSNIDVILPDLQRFLTGGAPTQALLQRMPGIGSANREDMKRDYADAFKTAVDQYASTLGGTIADKETAIKRMAPALFGTNISAYGGGAEAILELLTKGTISNLGAISPDLIKRGMKDQSYDLLSFMDAVGKLKPEATGGGMSKFNLGADKIYQAAEMMLSLEQKKTLSQDIGGEFGKKFGVGYKDTGVGPALKKRTALYADILPSLSPEEAFELTGYSGVPGTKLDKTTSGFLTEKAAEHQKEEYSKYRESRGDKIENAQLMGEAFADRVLMRGGLEVSINVPTGKVETTASGRGKKK